VPAQSRLALRPLQLPAVLQVPGYAPHFVTLATLSEQGVSIDFASSPPAAAVLHQPARLDFDFLDAHYSFSCRLIQILGGRGLVSLQEAPAAAVSALHAVNRQNVPRVGTRLRTQGVQQACYREFIFGMRAVVDHLFLTLRKRADAEAGSDTRPFADLQRVLLPRRPGFVRQFTEAYPYFPQSRGSQPVIEGSLTLVDVAEVDDWIRRSGIAHEAQAALDPLPVAFNRQYEALKPLGDKAVQHPYLPEAVLDVLADLIQPLGLDADMRVRCYELMADALRAQGAPIYEAMLHVIDDTQHEWAPAEAGETDLAGWLLRSARADQSSGGGGGGPDGAAFTGQLTQLAEHLAHVTQNLGDLAVPGSALMLDGAVARNLVPGLLARERILERFLPAPTASMSLGAGESAALEGLYAQLTQPPPIEPGPERLAQASQVRALMLQAQGLLLEYTLNGLTYQEQPDHPAWRLINALDLLHLGADDQGQFLDDAIHQACHLSMQWLLRQVDSDTALAQVNALLDKIVAQLRADHDTRRAGELGKLGTPSPAESPLPTGWCVVHEEDAAVPYAVLGKFAGRWALLNRSATRVRTLSDAEIADALDADHIVEAGSYDQPFLERVASATLTASLNAVHTFTWQDPESGCLKRSALMDELERRLDEPVSDPPSFCALIEIPCMRSGACSLQADELTALRKQAWALLSAVPRTGEQCARLSDVAYLFVFQPQEPDELEAKLRKLAADVHALHAESKAIGAVVPLLGEAGAKTTPPDVLRRANLACVPMRQQGELDLSILATVPPPANRIDPLPFDALHLRAQRITACSDGKPSHYEILLGVSEDLVPAHTTQSFVVMAEQTGRSHGLDAWVLRSVLDWMSSHPDIIDELHGISVNLSGNSLVHDEHVNNMLDLLAGYPTLVGKIILEVTETAAISNMETAVRALRKLRRRGCRVALDDFGSGYSSYSYLRQLPLDYLKIDGTYIRNILNDKTDQALTASMVDVAHALGIKVIAEYVDSEATFAWLRDLGVDYVQGYWVHEPQPLDTLALH